MKFVVYAIQEPNNGTIRYVGISSWGTGRMWKHIRPSHYENERVRHFPLYCWIRSLAARGISPEPFVLEECGSIEELDHAEVFWIDYLRSIGCPLLNLMRGGYRGTMDPRARALRSRKRNYPKGRKSAPLSSETREKISTSKRGRKRGPMSDETKEKISFAQKGKKKPRMPMYLKSLLKD